MRLIDFLATQYRRRRTQISATSLEQLAVVARLLERQTGRPITTADLTLDLLLDFVAWLRDHGRSDRTIKGRMQSLLVIWREAKRRRLAGPVPDRDELPDIRVGRAAPRCWRIDEFSRLVAMASLYEGRLPRSTIPRRDWWTSLLLFLYDSGARIGAALSIMPEDIDLERQVVTLSHRRAKTGIGQVVRISEQTAVWLSRLLPCPGNTVWGGRMARQTMFTQLAKLLEQAGLPADRRCKFHRIRRTHATYVAICASLESAQRGLGHTTARMTLESYIDPTLYCQVDASQVIPRPTLPRSA